MLIVCVIGEDCAERFEEVGFWVWVFSGGGWREGNLVCEQHLRVWLGLVDGLKREGRKVDSSSRSVTDSKIEIFERVRK